jgi:hypothetical protein
MFVTIPLAQAAMLRAKQTVGAILEQLHPIHHARILVRLAWKQLIHIMEDVDLQQVNIQQ